MFGDEGKVLYAAGHGSGAISTLLVDGDGNILVVGRTVAPGSSGGNPAAVRFTSTGVLDSTFGSNGVERYGKIDYNAYPTARAAGRRRSSDDRRPTFEVAERMDGVFVLRTTPTGQPDPTFGVGGNLVAPRSIGKIPSRRASPSTLQATLSPAASSPARIFSIRS